MRKVNLLMFVIYIQTFYSLAQINRPIGINISEVNDYSTELVFTDAFKQCREWISSNADGTGPWNTNISVPLSSNGYPLQIPYNDGVNPPQIVKTLLLWDIGSAAPTGLYRLVVSGNGTIRFSGGASGTFSTPIDTLINASGQIILEILQSNISNPINDIKFILPNYVNNYQTQIFTTEFLTFLDDFQVIRFMDFTRTNNSAVEHWNDRTPVNYYTQSKHEGAAWEYVIALANQTKKDIWINIPHKADNNYITQLANLLHNQLDTSLKIYLEFSNEVWNSVFTQHHECAVMAQNLGYTGQPWERAWKYTAKRSADIFSIFENVFVNDQRLIKVIPSFAANSWLTNQLITYFNDPAYNPTQVSADAVAIAPYFGNEVADDIVTNNQVNTITIPQILQNLQTSMTNNSFQWIMSNKQVADNHNLQLICYEGGQHLVATGANVNNNTLTNLLIATNHDAGLQPLYCDYLNFWYDSVETLFCHFSSHGTYNQFGSWGVKENFQDVNNPKYLALQNCVFNYNTNVPTSNNNVKNVIETDVYPNPSGDWVYVRNNSSNNAFNFIIADLSGRIILKNTSVYNHPISLKDLPDGIYILTVIDEKNIKTHKVIKKS